MKGDYQKSLKMLTLFFLLNPVPFKGQNYQKQKGPGTNDLLFFRLQNKFTKISLLVTYLTKFDDVIQDIFWVIPNITILNLCKPIHDIINYSTAICPFESGKCGKEEENYKNLNISRMKRRWNKKTFFTVFERLSLDAKIKIQ